MIDPKIFQEQFNALAIAFNRGKPYSKEFMGLLYGDLSDDLTTEEFIIACALVRKQEQYLPRAEGFIRKVKGETDPAKILWAQIVNAIDTGCPVWVSPEGMFALQSIGGMNHVRKTSPDTRRNARYEFENYYRCAGAIAKLPSAREFNPPPERTLTAAPSVVVEPTEAEIREGLAAARRAMQADSTALPQQGQSAVADGLTDLCRAFSMGNPGKKERTHV